MPPESEREVIVLDDEPWAFRYEHALPNPETGRRDFYVPCIKETDDCPACQVDDQDSAYVMFLSVLDTESYTNKHGVKVPYSRKLMVVKSRQQPIFTRKFQAKKSLRGLKVMLYRDGPRDPVIGNEIEFTGKRVSEAKLKTYKNKYKDRKGQQHVEDIGNAYDYAALFPSFTREQIGQLVGNDRPTPGSDREAASTSSNDRDVDGWEDSADDVPWEDEKPKRAKRTSGTRKNTRVKRRARA